MINVPKYIVIHCSDSPQGRGDAAEDIHMWHIERGFDGIGYHYVVEDYGNVECGRPTYWNGAHCKGHNHDSIGICIIGIGSSDFSQAQINATVSLARGLMNAYDICKENVLGHYEADKASHKTCPNMDMNWFRELL